MATWFVSAVDGNDVNAGTSWATARQTVTGGLALATTDGDIIKTDSAGSLSAGSTITWAPTATVSVISVNRAGGDAYLAGAAERVNSNAGFNILPAAGKSLFVRGFTLRAGNAGNSGAANLNIATGTGVNYGTVEFDDCNLFPDSTNTAAGLLLLGISSGSGAVMPRIIIKNCTLTLPNQAPTTSIVRCRTANVEIINPTVAYAGANKPKILFGGSTTSGPALVRVTGDLSAFNTSGGAYIDASTLGGGAWTFENIKVSATPAFITNSFVCDGASVVAINVDSGNTQVTFGHYNHLGTLLQSTATYASDSAAFNFQSIGVSWQIVTTSACSEAAPYITPFFSIWNAGTSSVAVTAEIIQDNASNLTDRDVWLDVEYLPDASDTTGALVSSRNASPFLGTPNNLAAGAATWTGTGGMTNPNKQKLVPANITPGQAGPMQGRVSVGKAGQTLYVDPQLRLSGFTPGKGLWNKTPGAFMDAAAGAAGGMLVHPGMSGRING